MYPTHWIEHRYQSWICDSYGENGYNGIGYFSTMQPIGEKFAGKFLATSLGGPGD